VWRFWLEPAGLTLRRRKTGHIPSRHNSYSANPKDDDKEKLKGIIIERPSIWITTGIFLFAGQKKKGTTLLNGRYAIKAV